MSSSDDSGGDRGLRAWVVMKLNRWVLTGAILFVVFVSLVALSFAGLSPLEDLAEDGDALQNIFSSMIGPIITGVTLVVTIGQVVLSQELGAVGDQRERMQEAIDFRQDIESAVNLDTSPPEPAAFLREMVAGTENRAENLREVMEDERDEELQEKIEEYVADLDENAETVREGLEDSQFGTFEVIWSALNFGYSRKIFDARKIREDHQESLSEDANDAIDEMIETLKLFGPAREHFKTLYFQWELINLSRAILYAAIPALTVVAGMRMYVDVDAVSGATMGIDNLVLLTSGAFTVSLIPFVILLTYVLRIATVAQRTLAMGPFILRESERDADSNL